MADPLTLRRDTVAVVGSGLGGLSAACTLAARGYDVELFEANDWLGGKATRLRGNGFTFDMGPTIGTVPTVFERVFAEAGEDLHDRLDIRRLDPQWRCFYEDGSVLDLADGVDAMAAAIEEFAPGSGAADGYRGFQAWSERLQVISENYYFWRSVGGFADLLRGVGRPKLKMLADVAVTKPGRSVSKTVRSFVSEPRVAQLLDHFTQYVGSAPDQSPAVLCSMAHLQADGGVWYPMGGVSEVPRALVALGERLGVRYHTGSDVERILLDGGGAVRGLRLRDGGDLPFGAVVSNMDSVRTHRELLGGDPARRFDAAGDYEPACSGVVLYLGLDRRYEHLAHHDFVFSRDPDVEFEDIYRRGIPAADPTVYLAAPSVTDPSVAPEGGEALYALVHTPYLRPGQDWNALFPAYREVILDKLERCAGLRGIRDRIVFEARLTPQDIHDRYRVLDGAIYGLASHGLFAGAIKPPNRSSVPGLYLAGGATHPGPGMPMVTMSGWIAADCLDRDGVVRPARPPAHSAAA